jgi:glycosyltransferase involved in cell wall biosynthesis
LKKNVFISSLFGKLPPPLRLTDVASWHGHIPFAFFLSRLARPSRFVELGTHKGDSFCAFLSAFSEYDIPCDSHAVDTWEGDSQAGFYGPEIQEELRAFIADRWPDKAKLHPSTFDDAVAGFADGSIDLLHIDGLHTYGAVKHDFETWLPKMSSQGIVLFHDTQVFHGEFGVWKFWEEVRDQYPSLEFLHSHGLGVLGVGENVSEEFLSFLQSRGEILVRIRHVFSSLGRVASAGSPIGEETMARFSDILEGGKRSFDPENPKISTIIPTYNHEDFIREAIYSVLVQTEPDFELILIDDGSSDSTPDISDAIVQYHQDPRIRRFRQENQGAHAALNRGVELSRGEWIAVLNSDDVWHTKRLEVLLSKGLAVPDCAGVFSWVDWIDGAGAKTRLDVGPPAAGGVLLPDLLEDNYLSSTSNLFCRREVFRTLGGFSPFRYVHDWDFFLRVSSTYPVYVVPESLLSYRIHGASTFKGSEAAAREEAARMLLAFLINLELEAHFETDDLEATMSCFLKAFGKNSLDRALWVPTFFALRGKLDLPSFLRCVGGDDQSIFRKTVVSHFENVSQEWENAKEAWNQWELLNRRFHESEQRWVEELGRKERRLAAAEVEKRGLWERSQAAWKQWEETHSRLLKTEKRLQETAEKADRSWMDSQSAWKQWEETNRRLVATADRLGQAETERDALKRRSAELEERLGQLTNQLNEVLQSRSYRLGSRLLAPARSAIGLLKPKGGKS